MSAVLLFILVLILLTLVAIVLHIQKETRIENEIKIKGGIKGEIKKESEIKGGVWDSGNEILTAYSIANNNEKKRLLSVLSKPFEYSKRLKQKSLIENLIRNKASDSEIYNYICNESGFSVQSGYKKDTYFQLLSQHVNLIKPKYLDVGGGDGKITEAIAKGLNTSEAHCIDIIQREDNSMVKYHKLENYEEEIKFPFQDNYFDIITSFMVLHHVKLLDEELSEIYRVLKPGGIFYIREHNSENKFDQLLIDIEHMIYIICNCELVKNPYIFNHRNMNEWVEKLEQHKFKPIIKPDYFGYTPHTKGFYLILKK